MLARGAEGLGSHRCCSWAHCGCQGSTHAFWFFHPLQKGTRSIRGHAHPQLSTSGRHNQETHIASTCSRSCPGPPQGCAASAVQCSLSLLDPR